MTRMMRIVEMVKVRLSSDDTCYSLHMREKIGSQLRSTTALPTENSQSKVFTITITNIIFIPIIIIFITTILTIIVLRQHCYPVIQCWSDIIRLNLLSQIEGFVWKSKLCTFDLTKVPLLDWFILETQILSSGKSDNQPAHFCRIESCYLALLAMWVFIYIFIIPIMH